MNENEIFKDRVRKNIKEIGEDKGFIDLTHKWLLGAIEHEYAQNFTWMGRPIIQVPQDIYAIQELVWTVKPDLIIETGIAHGGSLILSASMLAILDYCDAVESGKTLDPTKSKRKVLGLDIDIREHNRTAIKAHPMSHMIEMIEGSSIDAEVISQVHDFTNKFKTIMVMLDSNHTHDHVLEELKAYAPLVSPDSYCVVWDSGVEDLPEGFVTDRPWGKGNNPKTALLEYINNLSDGSILATDGLPLKFEIDKEIEHKIAITASADGFLRRC